ncbi:hypothetical protein [Acinetobacter pittii]|uniref:hypothetical protein n=1 Tax=Acinetobacter pittii TaxID=48296 RepID=UPI001980EC9E|nr:hypothetical protein [Acinetobacter pittii]MBN6492781.1 hypothetical protein [Acinetobacter pittii]
MVKKTLEHKIKDLIFCTFAFLILYLIIGFMLQTEWLDKRLDLKGTYELLKDGLTITASFLAPVAAFVLFSDWRIEHRLKNLENSSKSVVQQTQELYSKFFDFYIKLLNAGLVNKEKVNNYLSDLTDLMIRVDMVRNSFGEFYNLEDGLEFIGEINKTLYLFNDVSSDLNRAIKIYETEYLNQAISYYADFNELLNIEAKYTHMNLELIKGKIDTIRKMASEYEI